MSIQLEHIKLIHWLLAFGGMLLHLLFKIEKARKKEGYTFGRFFQENVISTMISTLIIILCMFVCDDPAIAQQVPITYATSVFLGWQSRSFFKSMMDMTKKKTGTEDNDEDP